MCTHIRKLTSAAKNAFIHMTESRQHWDTSSFHCAMIFSKNACLSVGINKKNKRKSFVEKSKTHNVHSLHAECDAILKARKKIDLTKAIMYVAKVDRNGTISQSKPCKMCEDFISAYKIKCVYYTITADEYGVLNINK